MIRLLFLFFLFVFCQLQSAVSFVDKTGAEITIESCQNSDLPSCRTLFFSAFSEAYKNFTEKDLEVPDKMQFLDSAFNDIYEDFQNGVQKLVVAKKDKIVIGFVGFKETETPHQVYISQLAVKPEYWSNGIGKQLVFSVFDHCEGTTHLVVIHRKSNTLAGDFYTRLGFTRCDYIHPEYSPERYVGYEWFSSQEEICLR